MNYTENYHLPQWEETDRVMRTDFNDAMLHIEEGLTVRREGESALRGEAWNRLCRTAYNHYCAVSRIEPFPRQLGVFYQNTGTNTSGISGTIGIDGAVFAGKGRLQVTASNFADYVEQVTPLKMVKNKLSACTPLELHVRLPAAVKLMRFVIGGTYSNNAGGSDPCRVCVINQDTGETEWENEKVLGITSSGGTTFRLDIDLNVFLHAETDYTILIRPLAAIYDGSFDYLNAPSYTILSCYRNNGVMTASRTMTEPEGSTGGMMILRCQSGGTGGTLEAAWDKEPLEPSVTRTILDDRGREMQEIIFLRDKPVPPETVLEMKFTCNEGGDFFLYDWGAVLL